MDWVEIGKIWGFPSMVLCVGGFGVYRIFTKHIWPFLTGSVTQALSAVEDHLRTAHHARDEALKRFMEELAEERKLRRELHEETIHALRNLSEEVSKGRR